MKPNVWLVGVIAVHCAAALTSCAADKFVNYEVPVELVKFAKANGAEIMRVAPTGSMKPVLDENTLVVVKPVRADEIGVRDVIVFHRDGQLVMHRVVAHVTDESWRTKGDANKITDVKSVRYSQVVGRVIHAHRFSRL